MNRSDRPLVFRDGLMWHRERPIPRRNRSVSLARREKSSEAMDETNALIPYGQLDSNPGLRARTRQPADQYEEDDWHARFMQDNDVKPPPPSRPHARVDDVDDTDNDGDEWHKRDYQRPQPPRRAEPNEWEENDEWHDENWTRRVPPPPQRRRSGGPLDTSYGTRGSRIRPRSLAPAPPDDWYEEDEWHEREWGRGSGYVQPPPPLRNAGSLLGTGYGTHTSRIRSRSTGVAPAPNVYVYNRRYSPSPERERSRARSQSSRRDPTTEEIINKLDNIDDDLRRLSRGRASSATPTLQQMELDLAHERAARERLEMGERYERERLQEILERSDDRRGIGRSEGLERLRNAELNALKLEDERLRAIKRRDRELYTKKYELELLKATIEREKKVQKDTRRGNTPAPNVYVYTSQRNDFERSPSPERERSRSRGLRGRRDLGTNEIIDKLDAIDINDGRLSRGLMSRRPRSSSRSTRFIPPQPTIYLAPRRELPILNVDFDLELTFQREDTWAQKSESEITLCQDTGESEKRLADGQSQILNVLISRSSGSGSTPLTSGELYGFEGQSGKKQSCHFRWAHIQQDNMDVDNFFVNALRIAGMKDTTNTAISNARDRIRAQFTKPVTTGQTVKGRHMIPNVFFSTRDSSHDASLLPRILFFSLPFLVLGPFKDNKLPRKSALFPTRPLLQSQNSAVSKERELSQVLRKLGLAAKDDCFHLSQVWCLAIGDDFLITCSTLPVADLVSDACKINTQPRPERSSAPSIDGIQYLTVRTAEDLIVLPLVECQTWLELISHFATDEIKFEESYTLTRHDKEVTRKSWPAVHRDAYSSNLILGLASKSRSVGEPTVAQKEPHSEAENTPWSAGNENLDLEDFHVFTWVSAVQDTKFLRASTSEVVKLRDYVLDINRYAKAKAEVQIFWDLKLNSTASKVYRQIGEKSLSDISALRESLMGKHGQERPESDFSRSSKGKFVWAAKTVLSFFFPLNTDDPLIRKYWGAVHTILSLPDERRARFLSDEDGTSPDIDAQTAEFSTNRSSRNPSLFREPLAPFDGHDEQPARPRRMETFDSQASVINDSDEPPILPRRTETFDSQTSTASHLAEKLAPPSRAGTFDSQISAGLDRDEKPARPRRTETFDFQASVMEDSDEPPARLHRVETLDSQASVDDEQPNFSPYRYQPSRAAMRPNQSKIMRAKDIVLFVSLAKRLERLSSSLTTHRKEGGRFFKVPSAYMNAWLHSLLYLLHYASPGHSSPRLAKSSIKQCNQLITHGTEELIASLTSGPIDRKFALQPRSLMALIVSRLLQDVVGDCPDVLTTYATYMNELKAKIEDNPLQRIHQRTISHFNQEIEALIRVLQGQWQVIADLTDITNTTYRTQFVRASSHHDMGRVEFGRAFELLLDQKSLILQKIEDLNGLAKEALALETFSRTEIESTKDRHDAAIYAFTIVTVIFLPLSFVTGFLGMNTIDIRNSNQSQWIFWAVGVPITVLVILVALLWSGEWRNIRDWLRSVFRADKHKLD